MTILHSREIVKIVLMIIIHKILDAATKRTWSTGVTPGELCRAAGEISTTLATATIQPANLPAKHHHP